jgi:hypothetical protein
MHFARVLAAAALFIALPAAADFNDKKPVSATVTGATPSGYPRTMVEGLNAVVRDAYPGSAVSFKPNSPGGGVLAIAERQADFTATATGTEIRLANEGKAPYTAPLKGKFSYVMQLYDNQFIHFLMTKEWAEANGIKSWADIAKKKPRMRLAINRPDNPQTTIGGPYEVMKAYGFSINDIEKWGGSFVLGNSAIGLEGHRRQASAPVDRRRPGDHPEGRRHLQLQGRHGAGQDLRLHGERLPDRAHVGGAPRRQPRARRGGLQVREGHRRERGSRAGDRRFAQDLLHHGEHGDQSRRAALSSRGAALLQGEGVGEVTPCAC